MNPILYRRLLFDHKQHVINPNIPNRLITHIHNVRGQETAQTSRAVLDGEFSSILFVTAGFGRVVLVVHHYKEID